MSKRRVVRDEARFGREPDHETPITISFHRELGSHWGKKGHVELVNDMV